MSEKKYRCINCGAELDKFNTTELAVRTLTIDGKESKASATLKVCDDCFQDAREMMKELEDTYKHNES